MLCVVVSWLLPLVRMSPWPANLNLVRYSHERLVNEVRRSEHQAIRKGEADGRAR
jgi:hypothetical protein